MPGMRKMSCAFPVCGTEGSTKRCGTGAGIGYIGKQNTGTQTAEPLVAQKVLSDGDIGSAVFIERRNQLDTELEEISRRQQFLKSRT